MSGGHLVTLVLGVGCRLAEWVEGMLIQTVMRTGFIVS